MRQWKYSNENVFVAITSKVLKNCVKAQESSTKKAIKQKHYAQEKLLANVAMVLCQNITPSFSEADLGQLQHPRLSTLW